MLRSEQEAAALDFAECVAKARFCPWMTRTEIIVQSKLMNCERIAWRQRALTMQEARERGAGWTPEDAAILYRMNLADRPCWDKYAMRGNGYHAHRNYRENLNA